LIAIKNKKISLHKKLNITTFLLSSVFLVLYIIFHAFGVETKFPDDNPLRPFYLVILITHIILAATVLPLVLVSLFLGLTGKIERHKKVSRFTFPIWLYVTVTGVVVYLMISPYYQF
jgi:putative membrane protein